MSIVLLPVRRASLLGLERQILNVKLHFGPRRRDYSLGKRTQPGIKGALKPASRVSLFAFRVSLFFGALRAAQVFAAGTGGEHVVARFTNAV
ncbi:MAG: hypothetical protein ACE5HB_07785, partial [Terriglobia bacterium]